MDLLVVSQIIFNFVATLAILVVGVLFGVVAYELIKVVKSIQKFFQSIHEKSAQIHQRFEEMVATASVLPFISRLFKKKKSKEK